MARSASFELVGAPVVRAERTWWAAAVALSVVALASREVGRWSWVVAVCGGVIGIVVPLTRRRNARVSTWFGVAAIGVLAFLVARSLWSLPAVGDGWAVSVSVATAVAEEALFRRGLYGVLERWGVPAAVAGTATVFALVHVPMYGWASLPVDLTAGLVFGWQRWATGSWTAPAFTHSFANLIQYA